MLPRPLYIPDYNGYSRRRSRSRRSSRRPKPEYDRNIVSAFFALASAVLLAIAEAEPKWLRIVGGRCSGQYIGLYKVIAYRSPEDLSGFCYTRSMVLILRVSVALSCGGIVFSMFACLLDLCGTMNRCLKVIKDYSIGNVISVIMCTITSLLTYWVTQIIEVNDKGDDGTPVRVRFDISFYLVAAAAVSSVLATGLSLFMLCLLQRSRERTRSHDDLSMELMYSMLPADSLSEIPPPAYSP